MITASKAESKARAGANRGGNIDRILVAVLNSFEDLRAVIVSYAEGGSTSPISESALCKLIAVGMRLMPERMPLPYLLDDMFWGLYRKPSLTMCISKQQWIVEPCKAIGA